MARKILLEKKEISDTITMKLFITNDESELFVKLDYNNGKVKVSKEKGFKNNSIGSREMEEYIELMGSEKAILEYFNI